MKKKFFVGIALVAGIVLAFPDQLRRLFQGSPADVAESTSSPEGYAPGSIRHEEEGSADEPDHEAFLPPTLNDSGLLPPEPRDTTTEPPVAATAPSLSASNLNGPTLQKNAISAAPELSPDTDPLAGSSPDLVRLPPTDDETGGDRDPGPEPDRDTAHLPDLLAARSTESGPSTPPAGEPQKSSDSSDSSASAESAEPVDPSKTQTQTPFANSPPAEDRNLIFFARDLVQLEAPDHWFVSETAAGRDVRLVLTPDRLQDEMQRGVWLCCHVLREDSDLRQLETMLTTRVSEVTDQANNISTEPFSVGPWNGWRAEFDLSSAGAVGDASVPYRGFHFLVPTPWALVEGHGLYPADQTQVAAELEQLLSRMQLQTPRQWTNGQAVDSTQDAASIFGVWKSSHGRFRIYGNGRIDLEKDKVMLLSTPASRQEAERLQAAGPPRLRGTYQAAGDVIEVTWDDGSRLNLRWKQSQGKLLLTDHLGQISKLKPLLE